MDDIGENTHRALKRMLGNGLLTGLPKRPADQQLLVGLAASRFDARKAYREGEVNELLKAWLGTFCAPFGIDHVTMRRMLVDSRYLARDSSGSAYRVDPGKVAEAKVDATADPARVLAEIQSERESRKRASGSRAGD